MESFEQSGGNASTVLTEFVRRMPVAVAMFDRHMRYLEASERWCTDYGLAHDAIIGRSYYEVFPDLPPAWREMHRRGLRGESVSERLESFPRPDQPLKWLRGEVGPWGGRNGQPDGILIVTEDVTDQKLARDALVQAIIQYRDLADNSPDMICRLDTQDHYTFVNTQFLEVTNKRESEFIGHDVGSVIADNPATARWRDAISRVKQSGRDQGIDFSFTPSGTSGTLTTWEARFVPETGPDRTLRSVLMIATDVTGRRDAEARARSGEQATHERDAIITALFDTASQAIFGVDRHGTILLANRMVDELFGYEPGSLIGLPHDVLLPDALRERHAAHREAFFRTPARRPMAAGLELQARRKDGTCFPVEVSLSFVHTAHGPIAVSFVTDISTRVAQQAALRSSAQELRRLNAALLTAEEDMSRRIARELHDDITQRLALVSMEIGRSASSAANANASAYLHTVQSQLLAIGEGVRRISHQMHPAILDDLGLSAALERLCLDIEKASGVPIAYEADALPDDVSRTAAYCLYRVCQESLLNVSKHANAGYATVTLSCDDDCLVLDIVDTGIGFDPAKQTPGLGTLTMKERVRLANGSLRIRSAPGGGTHVSARLPRRST